VRADAGRNPLAISLERVWLYGAACATVASLPFILLPWFHDVAYRYDFACFWSAGANAGTTTLTDPQRLREWAATHHMIAQPFSYPPAFAWFYAPLSRLPPMRGLAVEELLMTAIFAIAALLAARTYGFGKLFSIAAVLAWAPTVSSIEVGQNTALAVALIFVAGWALTRNRSGVAGLAVGLLLYKPTVALPLVLLLLARKEWRAIGITALCAAGWYVASVAASGGDLFWPRSYLQTVTWWLPLDFAGGPSKAFTIPTMLMALGVHWQTAWTIGVVILALALPIAARVSAIEAASVMPLVGLTASIHAWPYDAATALPAVFFAMTRLREPWRTPVIAAIYLGVALGMVVQHGVFALAAVCGGGTALWVWSRFPMAVSVVPERPIC